MAQQLCIEPKKLAITGFLVLTLGALMGASCEKSKAKSDDTAGAAAALDRSDGKKPAVPPAAEQPVGSPEVTGIDISSLDDTGKKRFARLLDKLPSPCGKAHSLRTSIEQDTTCKRASFAGNYLVLLISEDAEDDEISGMYDLRFRQEKAATFTLEGRAHIGDPNAPVVMVEFFDFGCGHCRLLAPLLEQVTQLFPDDVVLYYKNFPLSHNEHGIPAAKAAIAADRQGKFKEMQDILFENQDDHSEKKLYQFAKKIGLDLARFDADYQSPEVDKQVLKDRQEGIDAEIQGTPTVYINGREFTDPPAPILFKDWVEEELAVNR